MSKRILIVGGGFAGMYDTQVYQHFLEHGGATPDIREALADKSGTLYKPLPPDRLYLPEAEWAERLKTAALARLTPFAVPAITTKRKGK